MVSIFYNKLTLNDTMSISISPLSPNSIEKRPKGVILKNGDEIVGINVFNVSKYIDIAEGYLFLTKKIDDFIQTEFGIDLKKYHTPKFVVGQILDLETIPDSHLTKTIVNLGNGVNRQIICGGKNLLKGAKVVVAMPMTIMPNAKIIIPSKLLGYDSNGMICSRKELWRKDFPEDQPGHILILDDSYHVGDEFIEHYNNYKNNNKSTQV